MALKLISTLTVAIILGFTYKAWEKVRVPPTVSADEVWKAKTIDFVAKITDTISLLAPFFGEWSRGLVHSIRQWTFNILHTGYPILTDDESVGINVTRFYGVPVRVYFPLKKTAGLHYPIVYFHGGGWDYPSADYADPIVRHLCSKLGTVVVAVDYRSARVSPFPGPFHDAVSATTYVLNRPQELGVDPLQVIVAGAGNGAALAAAVALKLKKEVKFQILLYPILQALDFRTPSYSDNAKLLPAIMSARRAAASWRSYGNITESVSYKGASSSPENQHLDTADFENNAHISAAMKQSKYAQYVNTTVLVPATILQASASISPSAVKPRNTKRPRSRTCKEPGCSNNRANRGKIVDSELTVSTSVLSTAKSANKEGTGETISDKGSTRLEPSAKNGLPVGAARLQPEVPEKIEHNSTVDISSSKNTLSKTQPADSTTDRDMTLKTEKETLEQQKLPISTGSKVSQRKDKRDGSSVVAESKLVNPYFAPLMANDFSGVADAYVITSQFDPVRDDGVMYAQRLLIGGVRVTHRHYSDGFHSFMSYCCGGGPVDVKSGQKAMKRLVRHLHWVV